MQEFSTLVEENDALQRKIEVCSYLQRQWHNTMLLLHVCFCNKLIQSQEEEFRLQNRTLMEELGKVGDGINEGGGDVYVYKNYHFV